MRGLVLGLNTLSYNLSQPYTTFLNHVHSRINVVEDMIQKLSDNL